MNARLIISQFGGILLSLLLAFFGIFNVLFSDHFGSRDTEIAVGVVFILYFMSSVIIHKIFRTSSWKWFWLLVLPGAILGGGFSFPDQGITDLYTWTILLTMVVAISVGRMVTRLGGKNRITA